MPQASHYVGLAQLLALGLGSIAQAQAGRPASQLPIRLSTTCTHAKPCTLTHLLPVAYRLQPGVDSLDAFWNASLEYRSANGSIVLAGIYGSNPFTLTAPSGTLPWDEEFPNTGITTKGLITAIPDFQNVRGEYNALVLTLYRSKEAAEAGDTTAWLAPPLRMPLTGKR